MTDEAKAGIGKTAQDPGNGTLYDPDALPKLEAADHKHPKGRVRKFGLGELAQ